MKLEKSGIILNVENFDQCVVFYKSILGLQTLFEKTEEDFKLSCLEFGGSYLMLETGGKANGKGKSIEQSPAKLRINVMDLELVQQDLAEKGIECEIEYYSWGSTINLYDPDGNRIGIRDQTGFKNQIPNN